MLRALTVALLLLGSATSSAAAIRFNFDATFDDVSAGDPGVVNVSVLLKLYRMDTTDKCTAAQEACYFGGEFITTSGFATPENPATNYDYYQQAEYNGYDQLYIRAGGIPVGGVSREMSFFLFDKTQTLFNGFDPLQNLGTNVDSGYGFAASPGRPSNRFTIDNVTIATVPLPAAAWLFVTGIGGLIFAKKRNLSIQTV